MLILTEGTALSLRFATGILVHEGRWWSEFPGSLRPVPRLSLIVAMARRLLGGIVWGGAPRPSSEQGGWPRRSWLDCLVHLAAWADCAALMALALGRAATRPVGLRIPEAIAETGDRGRRREPSHPTAGDHGQPSILAARVVAVARGTIGEGPSGKEVTTGTGQART